MKSAFRVMIVDDERLSRLTTAQQLSNQGYEAEAIDNPFLALQRLESQVWDVVLTDLRMPGMSGLEFLREIRKARPDVAVILMTAFATVETAVEAMRAGAVDYLVKPFKHDELELRLRKIRELTSTKKELARLHTLLDNRDGAHGLLGRSPAMKAVQERINIFADHDAPVLITGETGTGKELVARALHFAGRRAEGPLIPIACGTIPLELAESELFGHEKGSFTGAAGRHEGSFERANGGTVLLDDVDDLPLAIQVKLLRVLQEGTYTRVGGTQEKTVDVRVVATSKIALERAVEEGKFRDDLFYRLRGLEIQLPRLAERGEDVLLLANRFLRLVNERDGAEFDEAATLSVEAAGALRAYSWPGNVRELRRAMESAFILARGGEIRPEHLPAVLPSNVHKKELFSLALDGLDALPFTDVVEEFEDTLLQWALQKAGGQQKRAAELLGIPRTTFQSRVARMRAT